MAYGVDQCRKCGKAMPPAGPEEVARYDLAKRQKPTMPEAEWRAQGWKAAPTRYQLYHKTDGVCRDCKWEIGNRAPRANRLLLTILITVVVLFVFVYCVESVFR